MGGRLFLVLLVLLVRILAKMQSEIVLLALRDPTALKLVLKLLKVSVKKASIVLDPTPQLDLLPSAM